jgi:hypothetical protein
LLAASVRSRFFPAICHPFAPMRWQPHSHNCIVAARSPVSIVLPYGKKFAEFAWSRSKHYQSAPSAVTPETPLDTIPGAPCIGRSWVSTARSYLGLRVALAARGKDGSAVRRVPARRKSDFCCESARRRLQKSDSGACAVHTVDIKGRVREDMGASQFSRASGFHPCAGSLDLSLPNPSCDRSYTCDGRHTRLNFDDHESLLRSSARVRARPSGDASNVAPTNSSTPAACSSSIRCDTVCSSPMIAASSGPAYPSRSSIAR